MKTSTLLHTLLMGFAVAIPTPQDAGEDLSQYDDSSFPTDQYEQIPDLPNLGAPVGAVDTDPIVYDASAAASDAISDVTDTLPLDVNSTLITEKRSVIKRGSCKANEPGNFPQSNPDTVDGFHNDPAFSAAANSAVAPPGYFLVNGWKNLQAAAEDPTYFTYISSPLSFYDVNQCADWCNDRDGCNSFNIFFERDPVINPDKTACPNVAGLTRIKCSFFGTALTLAQATRHGGTAGGNFKVAIAGSNAYTTTPQSVPGFTGPVSLGNAVIKAPLTDKSYIGAQTFDQDQPFDPNVCAAACLKITAFNTEKPSRSQRVCRFFDAFILYKNGANGVFTCNYYTKAYTPDFATNTGRSDDSGNHWTPAHSFTYTLNSS